MHILYPKILHANITTAINNISQFTIFQRAEKHDISCIIKLDISFWNNKSEIEANLLGHQKQVSRSLLNFTGNIIIIKIIIKFVYYMLIQQSFDTSVD